MMYKDGWGFYSFDIFFDDFLIDEAVIFLKDDNTSDHFPCHRCHDFIFLTIATSKVFLTMTALILTNDDENSNFGDNYDDDK